MLNRIRFETYIRDLEAFGHRGSATRNEARAAEYLVDRLRVIGLTPRIEAFRGFRSLPERCLVHILVAILGACLLQFPLLAIAIGSAGLLSFWLENTARGIWLSRVLPSHASANVVAELCSANPRRRVVLVAHYDTQRTGWIWILYQYLAPVFYMLPTRLKPAMLGLTAIFAGQIAVAVFVLFEVDYFHVVAVARFSLLASLSGFLILVGQWYLSPYVPGSGDNATGVAAVMTMAEAWISHLPQDVDLHLVLTGCEESGLIGAEAYVREHRPEFQSTPTFFLNMDNLGFGPPRFLGSDSPNCGGLMPYPQEMVDLADKVAAALRLIDAGPHSVPGPTDGVPFLAQGLPGVTIISFSELGRMPNYHRPQDTCANLDFDAAWSANELGWAVLQRLASRGRNETAT